jgi:hypothetical protein
MHEQHTANKCSAGVKRFVINRSNYQRASREAKNIGAFSIFGFSVQSHLHIL